jgi:hypothetical protein
MDEYVIRCPNTMNTVAYNDQINRIWTGSNLIMCLWKCQLTISVSDKSVPCYHDMEAFSACGWSGRPPNVRDGWEF